MSESIRSIYSVQVDNEDWPCLESGSIPRKQKQEIVDLVRKRLNATGIPTETYMIHDWVSLQKPAAFVGASLMDWRYGCIVRALREVATQKWVMN